MVVKVDLVIENAWVYRTFRQCFERMDIAVTGGKFFDVSPVSDFVEDSEQRVGARRGEWEAESVFDGTGKFVIPGLVDIHMHVESSMTYPPLPEITSPIERKKPSVCSLISHMV